jgi:succinate dehydrogenase/fumarate reductase flavoprotein subunit
MDVSVSFDPIGRSMTGVRIAWNKVNNINGLFCAGSIAFD